MYPSQLLTRPCDLIPIIHSFPLSLPNVWRDICHVISLWVSLRTTWIWLSGRLLILPWILPALWGICWEYPLILKHMRTRITQLVRWVSQRTKPPWEFPAANEADIEPLVAAKKSQPSGPWQAWRMVGRPVFWVKKPGIRLGFVPHYIV